MATIASRHDFLNYVQAYIMCAICEKPVDSIMREYSMERDTICFKVWCHGDTDNCEMTHEMMEQLGKGLEPGYAFTTKRLEGQDTTGTLGSLDSVAQENRGRELSRHVQLPDRGGSEG